MRPAQTKVQFSIRVPGRANTYLLEIANEHTDKSRASVVNEAVEEYLKKRGYTDAYGR